MAIIESDVLRLETTETGIYFAARNRQVAFATDTKKMIHKFQDGSIQKFIPEDQLVMYVGETGSPGVIGDQGYTGVQGETGVSVAGGTGLIGSTGLQGAQGIQGSTGAQGIQGNTGPVGFTGAQGHTGVNYPGVAEWRVLPDGRIQRLMVNKSGAALTGSWAVKQVTNVVENGVDYAEEDCQQLYGITDRDEVAASDNDPIWVTLQGVEECRMGYVDVGGNGKYVSMANTYSLANEGTLKSTDVADANTIGKCLEASSGVGNIARCWINRLPVYGISGYWYFTVQGFSDLTDILVYFEKVGQQVTMTLTPFSGTSNATTLYILPPAFLMPTNDSVVSVPANGRWQDNGSFVTGSEIQIVFDALNSRYEVELSGGWTASGAKALANHVTFVFNMIY